jgi:segregation and condensation protein A
MDISGVFLSLNKLTEELFDEDKTRMEVVVTFLAILELLKLKRIMADQEATFGRIVIRQREEEEE